MLGSTISKYTTSVLEDRKYREVLKELSNDFLLLNYSKNKYEIILEDRKKIR